MIKDTFLEKETTIVFNEAEGTARIWTASSRFQRVMQKLKVEPTRLLQRKQGEKSCWYTIPKGWVKIRKPPQLTEEQRSKLVEQAKKIFRKDK